MYFSEFENSIITELEISNIFFIISELKFKTFTYVIFSILLKIRVIMQKLCKTLNVNSMQELFTISFKLFGRSCHLSKCITNSFAVPGS